MSTTSDEARALGLAGLTTHPLTPAHEEALTALYERSEGSNVWRTRKRAECRHLLALSEIAPRFTVEEVDPQFDLKVRVRLRCPVPCMTPPSEELRVEKEAVLTIQWPVEAIRTPLPAFSFVQIEQPRDVFSANVSQGPVQVLCLGTHLPVGLPVFEIVLMSYGALSMQSVMIDETDPAGVLNAESARWWQTRGDLIPLSDVPFLGTADLEVEG